MAAKRPSKRRHRLEGAVDLPLIPVMSLMVVLVPMLLSTAVFEKIAAIQMNLPSADEIRYLQDTDPEDLKKSLTLAMTDEGYLLASGEEKLARIPLNEKNRFDFKGLEQVLARVKKRYPSQEAMVLLIEDVVIYDDIVHTMDQCRPFFPSVSLADRVIAAEEK